MQSENPTMPEVSATSEASLLSEFNTKLRDIEERQRLIKDRVLLIGENLVNGREESVKEIAELKVKTINLEREIERMKEAISSLIEETQNFARKNDVEILKKQFQMFEPFLKKE